MGTLLRFDTLVLDTGCGPAPRHPTTLAREPDEPPVGYGMKHRSIFRESYVGNRPDHFPASSDYGQRVLGDAAASRRMAMLTDNAASANHDVSGDFPGSG
jgi:hypothetical protein